MHDTAIRHPRPPHRLDASRASRHPGRWPSRWPGGLPSLRPPARRAAFLFVILGAGLLVGGAPTRPAGPPRKGAASYAADLAAFFAEMDRGYPFFVVKGIEKDWRRAKRTLARRAVRCRDDREFIGIVADAMKCLRDGHMSLTDVRVKMPPRRSEAWPGVALLPARGNRVVVMASVANLRATLPPGTVITRIDGKPARAVMEARALAAWREGGSFSSPQRARFFAYRHAFHGARGEKHRIHYRAGKREKRITLANNRDVKGWHHNYHLPDDLVRAGKSVWHGELDGGVGYVYLRRMDESVEPGLQAALDAHPKARAWIFDLRGNSGGGYSGSLGRLLGRFSGEVIGIIDAGCVSAGETFARDLVHKKRARLVGARSAGSSSSKKVWKFPSGIASLRYSVRSRAGVGGKPIEFNGIEPTDAVEVDPEDLTAGRNSEIEYALELLRRSR